MSLGRRYDVTRYSSVLLRGDTPGRYRKLSDDEIALEWERSRLQANGNTSPTANDASSTDSATTKYPPAREPAFRPSQSLIVGKKKDKAGKRVKSQSLSGKEDKLLRDIPVRQERAIEDTSQGVDSSFTNSVDQGQPVTLDVDLTVTTSEDAKKPVPVTDLHQTHMKPVLPIITAEERPEKRKKEKKTKVKDKKKGRSHKNTCEVHKHRKHNKESKFKKFFESNKNSDDAMNNPRHCRSCTCDLSYDHPSLDNDADTSDSSSLSSSHHEDSTSCTFLKHSDTPSVSSSQHAESSSPVSSSTPRDTSKHNVSSASEKSSRSSASGARLKVKPEKPQRTTKSPPSTPEPAGSGTKESPREQPTTSSSNKGSYRLNESSADTEGYASDDRRTPGFICINTDESVILQDGGSFEIVSGGFEIAGSSGFNVENDVVPETYVCFDEVRKEGSQDTAPEFGQATQKPPRVDKETPDTPVSSVQSNLKMTATGAEVGSRGSGIALPIITVPLENTMAYHSQLSPPAGFKEPDSSDVQELLVLTAPRQSQNNPITDVQVKLGSPDVRLDVTGDSEDGKSDSDGFIPHKEERSDMGKKFGLDIPNIEVDREHTIMNVKVSDPEMKGPDLETVSLLSSGTQIELQTQEPPVLDVQTAKGKKVALPAGPYVGIVVVSQESDSVRTDRPVRTDCVGNKDSKSDHYTSTSESESSSTRSSSSGGKVKSKTRLEKPKRKGKDKSNKKGEKEKITEGVESPVILPTVRASPGGNTEDITMPPAIRRAEKVEDISKTVIPEDVQGRTLDMLPTDVLDTTVPTASVTVEGDISKRDKVKVTDPDLKCPKLEAEAVDMPDIPTLSVDLNGTAREDRRQDKSSEIDSLLLTRTIHAPIPVLDLSVCDTSAESPEVTMKIPVISTKAHRTSSSDSDTSSCSDHRRKKGIYRYGDYGSQDNRDSSFLSHLGPLSSHSPLNVSQTLAATSNPNLNGLDKLDASLAHTTPVNVMDGAMPSVVRHRGHFVVVAIDFGTTFSGYALSFTRDPESVHMMRNWEGGDPGVINQKTPTTILLSPEGEFDSFGFTARDRYHNLTPDEAKKWLYFERFKMVLHHNPDLTKDTMLKACNGQTYPALNVFALAIRFFKEHALQQLSDQSGITIVNDDVRWVITVPAIWKAPAKQFMRQAAYEADLVSPDCPDQLLIALEPEAASIYCRKLRMYQLVPEHPEWRPLQSPRYSSPEPLNDHLACSDIRDDVARPPFDLPPDCPLESKIKGTRYMVVDCGGGTVDITVHELGEDTKLKELYKATGGPYGATAVDDEFVNMLCDIFGHEFIAHYRVKYPVGWLNLMINFESRKRSASPFKNNSLNVSLPFTFIDYFKKQKGGHIDLVVKKYGNKEVCWSSEGMLRLSPHAMRCLFVPVMEKIKHAIGDILNHPNARNLKYLFLVGGFAESPILQHDIRKEFSTILKVLIPTGVSLAILKGAVLFGLDPTIVNIRRSRLTYGVGVLNRFDPSRHPTSKLVHRDSVDWCTDVFDVFVHVDQPVALGDSVIRSYTPAKVNQLVSVIHIYSSDDTDSHFITDPGVRKCGTLCLDLSDLEADSLPNRREIQARMMFGDTEIKVSALDVATGRCVRANIDFLNK